MNGKNDIYHCYHMLIISQNKKKSIFVRPESETNSIFYE